MKRNLQTIKANRRAKTRPLWEARQAAERAAKEAAAREAAENAKPFNPAIRIAR
jgi:hypothetical protein